MTQKFKKNNKQHQNPKTFCTGLVLVHSMGSNNIMCIKISCTAIYKSTIKNLSVNLFGQRRVLRQAAQATIVHSATVACHPNFKKCDQITIGIWMQH